MKQQFITYKNEKRISLTKAFEIITLVFLLCTFSAFLILINIEKIEPKIKNPDEIVGVFKESGISEFLGIEKEENNEQNLKKEQIIKEYIMKNGEINVFKYFFNMPNGDGTNRPKA